MSERDRVLAEGYKREGWNARQPEIDALRDWGRRLRSYLQHAVTCKTRWTSSASGPRYKCDCGLAELLAAKEGSNDRA